MVFQPFSYSRSIATEIIRRRLLVTTCKAAGNNAYWLEVMLFMLMVGLAVLHVLPADCVKIVRAAILQCLQMRAAACSEAKNKL